MKIEKTASGSQLKISKSEWETIGKKAGWMKEADIKYKKDMPRRKREIDISGPQGNAFALIGIARDLAKQLGKDIEAITEDMQSDDYEHLLQVFDREFGSVVDLIRESSKVRNNIKTAEGLPQFQSRDVRRLHSIFIDFQDWASKAAQEMEQWLANGETDIDFNEAKDRVSYYLNQMGIK